MKQINCSAICFGLLFLFASCEVSDQSNKKVAEFSLLGGNEFVMGVDRISEMPDVQFPMDDLKESDYLKTLEGGVYYLSFSEDGRTVTIEPGTIHGKKVMDGDKSKVYELEEGEFAGGRFVVWISNNTLPFGKYHIYLIKINSLFKQTL